MHNVGAGHEPDVLCPLLSVITHVFFMLLNVLCMLMVRVPGFITAELEPGTWVTSMRPGPGRDGAVETSPSARAHSHLGHCYRSTGGGLCSISRFPSLVLFLCPYPYSIDSSLSLVYPSIFHLPIPNLFSFCLQHPKLPHSPFLSLSAELELRKETLGV